MQFGREWTKFAVRFKEVSGLESVRLERVDCTAPEIWGQPCYLEPRYLELFRSFSQWPFVSIGSYIVGMAAEIVAWESQCSYQLAHPLSHHREFGRTNPPPLLPPVAWFALPVLMCGWHTAHFFSPDVSRSGPGTRMFCLVQTWTLFQNTIYL